MPYNRIGYLCDMKLMQDTGPTGYTIISCADDHLRINDQLVRSSCIVSAQSLITDWPPAQLDDLTAEHVAMLAEINPEVILIGVGSRIRFPSPEVTRPLVERGIGFEVMDTAAACRTYNLLMGDGRKVVAGLILAAPKV